MARKSKKSRMALDYLLQYLREEVNRIRFEKNKSVIYRANKILDEPLTEEERFEIGVSSKPYPVSEWMGEPLDAKEAKLCGIGYISQPCRTKEDYSWYLKQEELYEKKREQERAQYEEAQRKRELRECEERIAVNKFFKLPTPIYVFNKMNDLRNDLNVDELVDKYEQLLCLFDDFWVDVANGENPPGAAKLMREINDSGLRSQIVDLHRKKYWKRWNKNAQLNDLNLTTWLDAQGNILLV